MKNDLALIPPFDPDARFQVGNAMQRNKYIYCLAGGGPGSGQRGPGASRRCVAAAESSPAERRLIKLRNPV